MANDLWQDLRYTLRTLRRDASFAVIAILILGVGIGSNTAIFSVLNTLLIRSLPFRDPGQLVWIANVFKGEGLSGETSRVANFNDLRKSNKSFEDMASYFAFFGDGDDTLDRPWRPGKVGRRRGLTEFLSGARRAAEAGAVV